ncbi:MAG: UPF0061 protein YdiU, partial [uncultured Sphingomonas sp.]
GSAQQRQGGLHLVLPQAVQCSIRRGGRGSGASHVRGCRSFRRMAYPLAPAPSIRAFRCGRPRRRNASGKPGLHSAKSPGGSHDKGGCGTRGFRSIRGVTDRAVPPLRRSARVPPIPGSAPEGGARARHILRHL